MDAIRVDAITVGTLAGLALVGVFLIGVPAYIDGRHRVGVLWTGSDGRPSTSKLQFYTWTAVTLFSYVLLWVVRARTAQNYHALGGPPASLMTAMGMSTLTLITAKGITANQVSTGRVDKGLEAGASRGGVFTDDGGNPDLTKIQLMAWTVVAVGVYLFQVYAHQVRQPEPALPDIDGSLAVLMGFGQAAYLGKKLITTDTPRLSGVSPDKVRSGTSVTLTGAALGSATSAQLTIDGVAISPKDAVWSDARVSFSFPAGPAPGQTWTNGKVVRIGVAANGLLSANEVPVTVFTGPQPTTLSPVAAKPGASITIDGELLDPEGRVLLDGAAVPHARWSAKAVTFEIPERHPNGSAWKPKQSVNVTLTSDGAAGAQSLQLEIL